MTSEKIVIGKGTDYPLDGLLTLPDDMSRKVPAVVFVHGSGSSNMDEKVGALTPFKDLAEGLAEHGIASVRYDKRSFSHGLRMVTDKKLTVTVKEETIEDAILAAEMLRSDPRVSSEDIYIIGHSMGAMLAPRIDAEGGNFKGLILMAGSLRKLEEIMLDQNNAVLSSLKGLSRWLIERQVRKLEKLFSSLYDLTDDAAMKKKFGGGTTLYYFKEMGGHPASDYLSGLGKPILIMQGEKDFQATVDKDFDGYRKLLKDRDNVSFKLYDGLNHAFVPAIYEGIINAKKEYAAERHIPDNVISDIAHWIEGISSQ